MGQVRKIKAGLVKISVNDFVGEDGNVFFDIEDGVMRLSDGATPGGIPLSSGGAEGGASTFRQLLDTPSSFANKGGTFLKVNPQASALEFVDVSLFDGDYSSLTGAPSLFDGAYSSLTGAPTLFSGDYADLSNKPTIPADVSDLTDTGSLLGSGGSGGGGTSNYNDLTNLPDLTVYQLAASAFSGDYDDLSNKPTLFSGAYADLTSKPTTLSGYGITDAATSAQGALADSALQSFTVTEGMVTAHQAALSITESQISDLQSYLTAVSEAQVTAHQAALSITESQISDFGTYLTTVAFSDLTTKPTTLSGYGITDAATSAQGALADTALQSFTETNDLTAAVVWANVPDANITQSSVTQHQAALSVTESQISDLQSYLTSVTFADLTTTPTTVAGYGITDVYTKTETDSAVSTAVSNLVGDAPAVLDTLSELADAIGDDADFLTTLNGNIALKANTADLATVATSGSYNDLADQPDVSDLTDVQGKLAAAGGVSDEDALAYSIIF